MRKPLPEVRKALINLIARYESVFTDDDVAVGKTDFLKMKIVLQPHVTPVRAPVRKIKPQIDIKLRFIIFIFVFLFINHKIQFIVTQYIGLTTKLEFS